MLLIPDPLRERLVANFKAGPRHDPVPVVKLVPDAGHTGLVQVANRRDPRATRSAPTSDGAARVGGACLPTWASPGGGVRGGGNP